MDLIKGIQKAIQYVEDNIQSDLDVKVIAEKAYVSPFHFQRLFLLLSGMTLGEYIRNRRLSLAAVDLQSSGSKIIELAMKYGYDTPESFSRAFVRFHGILPSVAKAKGAKFKSLSPLSIKVSLKGGSVLTYCIEDLKGFRLIGKAVRHGEGYEAPSQLWQQCHEDGVIQQLTEYSTSPDKELIGLTDGSSFDGETQQYYVAAIYDKDTVPEGYVVKEISSRTWIKFMCRNLTERHAEAEIWQRIYSEYFPASDYRPGDYQMVVYPVGDGNYPDEMGEVWVDVKRYDPVYLEDRPMKKRTVPFTPTTGWEMMEKLGLGITFALTTESRIWPWILEVVINDPMDSEICFGQPRIEEWHFKSAAMKGFDSYRLCVTWTPHTDENYTISKEWLDRIQQLTDWALDAGLNVVINTMHEEELYWLVRDGEYNAAKKHLTALWSQIADRFKDYPETLLFEIMNEPNLLEHYHGMGEWITVNGQISQVLCDTVNKLNKDALNVIRKSGGNNDKRVIILCVPGASPQALPYMKMPEEDRYIMFGVFGYDDKTSLEKDIIPPIQAWLDKGIAVVNKEDNSWSNMTHTKGHYDRLAEMGVPSFYFSSFYFSAIGKSDSEDIGFLNLTTGEWKNKPLLEIFFKAYERKAGPDFIDIPPTEIS